MANLRPFKAIAAISLNHVLGKDNAIPWHIPEDWAWVKQMTLGNTLIMGRKTYLSIGRPLPKRETIVISGCGLEIPGITVLPSFEACLSLERDHDVWIFGGATVYKQGLPYCSDLYLTIVKMEVEGDVIFPEFEPPFVPLKVIRDEPTFRIVHYTNPYCIQRL